MKAFQDSLDLLEQGQTSRFDEEYNLLVKDFEKTFDEYLGYKRGFGNWTPEKGRAELDVLLEEMKRIRRVAGEKGHRIEEVLGQFKQYLDGRLPQMEHLEELLEGIDPEARKVLNPRLNTLAKDRADSLRRLNNYKTWVAQELTPRLEDIDQTLGKAGEAVVEELYGQAENLTGDLEASEEDLVQIGELVARRDLARVKGPLQQEIVDKLAILSDVTRASLREQYENILEVSRSLTPDLRSEHDWIDQSIALLEDRLKAFETQLAEQQKKSALWRARNPNI